MTDNANESVLELNKKDQDPGQIKVSPTAAPAMAATGGRDFTLFIAALPAMVAIFGAHTVKDAIDFTQTTGFAPLGILIVALVSGIRQYITLRQQRNARKMAAAAPNSVAVVIANGWLSRLIARMGL